jgi:sulfur transfer complex TusBCD TusB component (DsrH family)
MTRLGAIGSLDADVVLYADGDILARAPLFRFMLESSNLPLIAEEINANYIMSAALMLIRTGIGVGQKITQAAHWVVEHPEQSFVADQDAIARGFPKELRHLLPRGSLTASEPNDTSTAKAIHFCGGRRKDEAARYMVGQFDEARRKARSKGEWEWSAVQLPVSAEWEW